MSFFIIGERLKNAEVLFLRIDCCEKKGLDGCYECEDLKECTKGFYQSDNDGASACKAQAMFTHKYGKEKFFYVHDKLHEVHD